MAVVDPFAPFDDDEDPLEKFGLDYNQFQTFKRREIERRSQRRKANELNELGKPPTLPPEILAERELYRNDYTLLHEKMFPHSTGVKPFGEQQKTAIRRFQRIIQGQGKLVQAEPRSFVKTGRAVNQIVKAVLDGDSKFVLIVSSAKAKSEEILEQIKTELIDNEEIERLYPMVAKAFQAIADNPTKAGRQTVEGKLTNIGMTRDYIRFPAIPGEPSSGSMIMVKTKDNIRGLSKKIRYGPSSGQLIRPDFCLLDDIQTDKEAKSPTVVSNIVSVIKRSLAFAGSHSTRLRVIMTITPNCKGDVASHFILKEPSYEVATYSMIEKMPERMDLWNEFGQIILNFDKYVEGDWMKAQLRGKQFVLDNYEELHKGSKVAWEWAYDWKNEESFEVSALHHAMILFYEEGVEAFNYECQCIIPTEESGGVQYKASYEQINDKIVNLPRYKVPLRVKDIVTHIDCNQDLLTYLTIGSDATFTPHIIDYGIFPPQPSDFWSKSSIHYTLASYFSNVPKGDVSTLIYQGASELIKLLGNNRYVREDNFELTNRLIGIDVNWEGESVYRAIRESPHRNIVVATQGLFYGVKDKPLMEQSDTSRDLHFHCYTAPGSDKVTPCLRMDVNNIKTLVHRSFIAAKGTIGSSTIFLPEEGLNHMLYNQHLQAEDPTQLVNEKDERVVVEWHNKRDNDNEYFDNTVGGFALLFKLGRSLQKMIPKTSFTDINDWFQQD